MPALIDIRRRIRTVKNTQQITKAMKMVSAAKLRRAQDAMFAARPYARKMMDVLQSVAARSEGKGHPLLERREGDRALLVVVTSDKGLCGGFNANIIRTAVKFLEERDPQAVELDLLGRKGRDFFKRRRWKIRSEQVGVFQALRFPVAQATARQLTEEFTSGRVDQVYLLYNEFKSVIQQRIVVEQLLPIGRLETTPAQEAGGSGGAVSPQTQEARRIHSAAPEDAPRPQPSRPAVPEEGHPGATDPGRPSGAHLVFQGRDGSLVILNRVQFRWTHETPDEDVQLPGTREPGAGKGSFRIRRAKTELTGWVWKRELTYELQLSWAGPEPGASTTTPLEDFLLNYDASGDGRFQVTVGQFKVPLGRQELTSSHRLQFPDRDILSGEFSRGRDIGVQLWGQLADRKVEYRAGIFNGNPASRLENDNDRYQYNARLMFQPWGEMKNAESDLEWSSRSLVAVAGQFEQNNLHGATNADDFDTRILGVDVAFKYRGVSALAEYFARHRTPEQAPSFDSNGFHAQAGYFVLRNRLEVAARFARYDPSDAIANDDREEIGAVVSYYLRPLHLLKMQGDWRRLRDEARGHVTHEVRLQTQIVF